MERENLFCFDINKENASIDREEFILRRESAAVAAERDAVNSKMGKAILKSVVGGAGVISICSVIFLMAGVACGLVVLFRYLETEAFSLEQGLMASFLLVLSGVLWGIKKGFANKHPEDDALPFEDELDRLNAISMRELRVPSDAKRVELFGYFYDKLDPSDPYDVDQVDVFGEDGMLCLHHVGCVIAIPMSSIEAVVRVKQSITFKDWTKDEPYDSEPYAQYHIVERRLSEYAKEYSMDGYYSIRFAREGEAFELVVPSYEIEPFLDILNMDVTEE
ncbi:MAG: hypothetical protein IKW66_02720 [Clostridia bacterium]|nr:hypothetical protein [Clostridia bacterium]